MWRVYLARVELGRVRKGKFILLLEGVFDIFVLLVFVLGVDISVFIVFG